MKPVEREMQTPSMGSSSVFSQAFLVEVANPKIMLFYITVLPTFANASYGHISRQIFLLGLIVIAPGAILFTVLIFAADALKGAFGESSFIVHRRSAISWIAFLTLSLAILAF